jgi:hypothetical protein
LLRDVTLVEQASPIRIVFISNIEDRRLSLGCHLCKQDKRRQNGQNSIETCCKQCNLSRPAHGMKETLSSHREWALFHEWDDRDVLLNVCPIATQIDAPYAIASPSAARGFIS